MATYYFGSDSCQVTIEAADADEAARKYAEGEGIEDVTGIDSLTAWIARTGGHIVIHEDGVEIAHVDD